MFLAIKKYKYNYYYYEDDCQNDSGGDRNSRSGPSLYDRHYPIVFLSVGKSSQLDLVLRRSPLPWFRDSGGRCYLFICRGYTV